MTQFLSKSEPLNYHCKKLDTFAGEFGGRSFLPRDHFNFQLPLR